MSDKSSQLATLAANINKGVDSKLKDVHTSMPGIIETFDPVNQLASIQPAIKRIFKTTDGEQEFLTPTSLPILINVPVQYPRGGGFSLTFPVKKGDECLLVFCERSIDNWHQVGGVQPPGARRFHSLSDATAFVGISSLTNKVPNYDNTNVQLKKDDGSVSITLKDNGDMDIIANGNLQGTIGGTVTLDVTGNTSITSPVMTLTGNVNIVGDLDVTGATTLSADVTSNGIDISDTHTHTGSPTAPTGVISPTGVPV